MWSKLFFPEYDYDRPRGQPGAVGFAGPAPVVQVFAGQGPVNNQAAADQLFLQQFVNGGVNLQGAGGLLGVAFRVPAQDGTSLLPIGTRITGRGEPLRVLPEPHYVYFFDPDPVAWLAHPAVMVYVRAGDGSIFTQSTLYDPAINGAIVLDFRADRLSNEIYRHPFYDLARPWYLKPEPQDQPEPPTPALAQGGSVANNGMRDVAGLHLFPAHDLYTTGGRAAGLSIFRSLGGTGRLPWDRDREDDRMTREEFTQAIRDAASGLGPEDKFVFLLTSHGGPRGRFQIGADVGPRGMPWRELCEILSDNVAAREICLIANTCYSQNAVDQFAEWESQTEKRVVVISTVENTPDRLLGDQPSIGLSCVEKFIREQVADLKEQGFFNPDELYTVLSKLGEIDGETTLTIEEKSCQALIALGVPEAQAERDKEGKEFSEPRSTGFDSRPDPTPPSPSPTATPTPGGGVTIDPGTVQLPPEILAFMRILFELIAAQNQSGAILLYDDDYNYLGMTSQQVTVEIGFTTVTDNFFELIGVDFPTDATDVVSRYTRSGQNQFPGAGDLQVEQLLTQAQRIQFDPVRNAFEVIRQLPVQVEATGFTQAGQRLSFEEEPWFTTLSVDGQNLPLDNRDSFDLGANYEIGSNLQIEASLQDPAPQGVTGIIKVELGSTEAILLPAGTPGRFNGQLTVPNTPGTNALSFVATFQSVSGNDVFQRSLRRSYEVNLTTP